MPTAETTINKLVILPITDISVGFDPDNGQTNRLRGSIWPDSVSMHGAFITMSIVGVDTVARNIASVGARNLDDLKRNAVALMQITEFGAYTFLRLVKRDYVPGTTNIESKLRDAF
jgi:hypothetical protein